MPELSSRTLFSGAEDICRNDLGCTEVNSFNTSVDAKLKNHFRWKGKAIATIGLSLSPDNDKAARGMLDTRGLSGPQGDKAGMLRNLAGCHPGLLPRYELPHC
jgi:hypothetical protein